MTKQPYPEEFKIEAVKQITVRGHRVATVSAAMRPKESGRFTILMGWSSWLDVELVILRATTSLSAFAGGFNLSIQPTGV